MFTHSRIQLESIVTDDKELFKIIIYTKLCLMNKRRKDVFDSSFIFMIQVVCIYLRTDYHDGILLCEKQNLKCI